MGDRRASDHDREDAVGLLGEGQAAGHRGWPWPAAVLMPLAPLPTVALPLGRDVGEGVITRRLFV